MKISSGKYRSLSLETLSGDKTRPTLGKVKEAIFSMLYGRVEGALVLDLFAGSGSLGIEALSNGAKQVDFYDNNKQAIEVIARNLERLAEENYQLKQEDYRKALKNKKQYDLIFIDPPYHLELIDSILKLIYENDLLSLDGIIVCEAGLEEKVNADYFELYKEKKYGKSKIYMFRRR